MGDVYRALDKTTHQTVAIKLLRATASDDEKARFRREISVLAELRHPSVVQYIGHGTWPDGRAFVAMEWLEGEDLQTRTRKNPLGMQDAVEVVRRAAAALAAIHSRGLVHRDLKLSNIWLCKGKGQRIKLIDFGVVRLPTNDGFHTRPGAIIGTPHYMAPEQARGEQVTPRSDVYALGSVLYRLITGQVVFPSEHVVALLGRLVLEDAPKVSRLRSDVPPSLEEVVAKAVARDAPDRFADAGELARALARVGELPNTPPPAVDSVAEIKLRSDKKKHNKNEVQEFALSPGMAERRFMATVVATILLPVLPEGIRLRLQAMLREGDCLEQVQGQRVVMAFGLGHLDGDELLRAARAALLIAHEVPESRVAIAAGKVIANRERFSAEALERVAIQLDKAAVGGVRVDVATVPLLSGRFVMRQDKIGAVLLHEDPIGTRTRMLLGKPTPMLGRKKELALLIDTFEEMVEDGAPRCVIVEGPSGYGKSRIRYELLRWFNVLESPTDILVCRGDPMTPVGELSALGRALRQRLGIQDGEPAQHRRAKLQAYVTARCPNTPNLLEASAFLGEIVGVHFPDTVSEALRAARKNPGLMKSRTRTILEEVVKADGIRTPQVLIVEDMQWADDVTLDLTSWLLGADNIRFCAFGFGRPRQASSSLWKGKNVTRIELAPLSFTASEKLVELMLQDASKETRHLLAERAGGNALFLEELIRYAAEGRSDLPLTIQAVIQTRIDSLDPDYRLVARAASVFGRSCWGDGVSALLDRPVEKELRALEQAEILTQRESSRISDQTEWAFRQALVRDTVYASLLEEDCTMFHARAATWLEVAGEEDFAVLAWHAAAGGDRHLAASHYVRATEQAYASGNMEAVIVMADNGLTFAEDKVVQAKLLLSKAHVYTWLGGNERRLKSAEDAVKLVAEGSDLWAEACCLLAGTLRDASQTEGALRWLERALAPEFIAKYPADIHSQLLAESARVKADGGRMKEARQDADASLQLAGQAERDREVTAVRAADARFLVIATEGNLGELMVACGDLVQRAEITGDMPLATRARINLGYTLNCLGMFDEAIAPLHRSTEDARRFRLFLLEAYGLHNLGMSYARVGQYDVALNLQRDARQIAQHVGNQRLRTASLLYEAISLVWRGGPTDGDEALNLAKEAQSFAAGTSALGVATHAVIASAQNSRRAFHAAIETAQECLSLIKSGGIWEWEELVRWTLIDSLVALGEREEANLALNEAFGVLKTKMSALAEGQQQAFLNNIAENKKIQQLARQLLGLQLPTVCAPSPPSTQTNARKPPKLLYFICRNGELCRKSR
jgi:eukaryotic-like serine/threonine-protein kinase